MGKRSVVLGAAVALVVGAIGPAWGSSSDKDKQRTFTLEALTTEEAGRLLACFPLFWWDHILTLLGTGLRFGELAGLRRRRVQLNLNRPVPVLHVVDTRYRAGRFGSGFKPRPKSDAGIRPVPLAPLVVEAIRRQLPQATTPRTWCSPAPAAAPAAAAGRACPAARGPCCPATTCTAPTRAPWPS